MIISYHSSLPLPYNYPQLFTLILSKTKTATIKPQRSNHNDQTTTIKPRPPENRYPQKQQATIKRKKSHNVTIQPSTNPLDQIPESLQPNQSPPRPLRPSGLPSPHWARSPSGEGVHSPICRSHRNQPRIKQGCEFSRADCSGEGCHDTSAGAYYWWSGFEAEDAGGSAGSKELTFGGRGWGVLEGGRKREGCEKGVKRSGSVGTGGGCMIWWVELWGSVWCSSKRGFGNNRSWPTTRSGDRNTYTTHGKHVNQCTEHLITDKEIDICKVHGVDVIYFA